MHTWLILHACQGYPPPQIFTIWNLINHDVICLAKIDKAKLWSLNVGMLEVQNSSSQQYGTTTVNESLCINQHSSQDCKLQTIDKFVRPYKTSLSIAGNFCSTRHQPHPPSHGGYQNNTSLCCSNPNVPPTHSYSRECELQLLYVATAAKCCS